MIKLTLLQLKVTIPIDHQQQLDMVALELREDIIIAEMVGNSTEKEWDLIGLGEGEWGCTYILGMDRHKKNLLIEKKLLIGDFQSIIITSPMKFL